MKKRMIWMIVALVLLPVLFYGAINLYATFSARGEQFKLEDAASLPKDYDAILVLGAGVRSDGTPSHMLEDRLLTCVKLFEAGVSDSVIVSGDHGTETYDEVNTMQNYLVSKGIPSQRIFMDHAGFSTYDSLYRAKEIFGAERLLIVTQEYHTSRALMIGRHLGISCESVSAPILSTEADGYSGQSWYSFRESVARCKDFLYSLFKPEPAYLGDPISLKGNGDETRG